MYKLGILYMFLLMSEDTACVKVNTAARYFHIHKDASEILKFENSKFKDWI